MEEETLYLHLHKLAAVNSEEVLENVLTTIWKTRKTGLSPPEKSRLQSVLSLPALADVDPVLACLRSLIRKCTCGNFTGNEIMKLFPPGLAIDLQSILIMLFQKHQNQWKEDMARDQVDQRQIPLPGTSISYQFKENVPRSFTSFSSLESQWQQQDEPTSQLNCKTHDASTTNIADANGSHWTPITANMSLQSESHIGLPQNRGILPRLKSMTWNMESQSSAPANKVAIVSLKLQDYTKSPLGELEVKFQLTRDTLEAMLKSMSYIHEQLSGIAGCSSGPPQKKQKQ